MKTRDELAKELSEKAEKNQNKEIADDFKLYFKNYTEAFLKRFLAVITNLDNERNLNNETVAKELKKAVKELTRVYSEVDIPQKTIIEIKKNSEISFENGTKKFLIWYFSVSFLIIAISIWFGIKGVTIKNQQGYTEKEFKNAKYNARKLGRTEIYNILPSNSKGFLDKKYPDKNKTFWHW